MTAPMAPGTRVYAQTQLPASNPIPSTGVWFVAGPTQRGPVGKPIVLRSMADYATYCGQRTPATAMLYDSLELFFRDGGVQSLVSRRVGPANVTAALLLKDQSASGAAALPAPTVTLGATATTGGTFTAGTYYWKVTATNAQGETTGSNEVTATLAASGTQIINWVAVPGATGYRVYRGAATGTGALITTLGAVTTYTDTGTTGSATTVPTSNTTSSVTTPLNTLQVSASSSGVWGNQVTVAVTVAASTFTITAVGPNGTETSPALSSPADAVNWSSTSQYVRVLDQGSTSTAPANNPAALAATPLAAGVDDTTNVSDATMPADLAVHTTDYGPGQVSVPGATTDLAHQQIVAHATTNNRVALLDAVDTPTAVTLRTAAANTLTGATDPTTSAHGGLFAPWIQIPGVPAGGPIPTATRTVPPSAMVAAGCARVDSGSNPNIAPAGDAGTSSYAIGVTQAYSDADRATLNAAGVNVARYFNGTARVKLYGFRTLSADPLHIQMNWARLDMAIFADARRIGAQVAGWAQIDQRDQVFSRLQGALTGMLTSYFTKGALYGGNPNDSFTVNVGPDINTLATRQAGQINAAIALKRSPVGEFVNIGVISVALAQSLS